MEAGTAKASAARPSFAAKHISKQITEDILPVTALKMEFMIRSISGTEGSGTGYTLRRHRFRSR